MKNSFETETQLKNDFDIRELIAKATATKPIREIRKMKDVSYTICKCPNCNISLISAKLQPYCENCGQHLDWSVEGGEVNGK